MFDFAEMYARARTAVFVWSMGITHHRFGVDNVKAIVNLGLAGGIVGRAKCGLMPIRGHSGVQGGSEMGANPKDFGLGFPVNDQNAARFEGIWGFRPPTAHGMTAVGMVDAAHAGGLDVLYMAGGNFLETLPEPDYVREAGRNREGGTDLRRDPGPAGEGGHLPVRGLPPLRGRDFPHARRPGSLHRRVAP